MGSAKFFTTHPPKHEHVLFVAPRPLPGRFVGRHHGMVFDVPPEFEAAARREGGEVIEVVTKSEYECLVEQTAAAGGYSKQDYLDADAPWDVKQIGFNYGLVLLAIEPV